jgi:hypothetical protein
MPVLIAAHVVVAAGVPTTAEAVAEPVRPTPVRVRVTNRVEDLPVDPPMLPPDA